MNSNQKIRGRAIFSEPEQVRNKSLKLYMYLVCIANLRNAPGPQGDNIRIFQQRDIILSKIGKILKMDERTIKKYWEQLENERLIIFKNHSWQEDYDLSFIERWKIRNKHKETYYEIPQPPLFRKVPKETIQALIHKYEVDELTLKIYMLLINYQEDCNYNGFSYKKFTYQDLRDILHYNKADINQKFENSLRQLKSLGLLNYDKSEFINTFGVKIPCFIAYSVNFYINFDLMDFNPAEENAISEEQRKRLEDNTNRDFRELEQA